MKNTFKFFGAMLLAGLTVFTACNPGEEIINPDNLTVKTYTLTVNTNDATMGSVTKTPDSTTYHAGTVVTIEATPFAGHKFLNWSGAASSTENTLVVTVSENATYTAVFEALPQVSYNATFDGSTLDIAGWNDFQTNGELWLLQFAQAAEGTRVSFPYLVMWMQGTNTSSFSVYPNGAIELYKDTQYTAGQDQYGDWQYYATENMNCTAMDLTTYMVSFTGAYTMYDLGDIVNQTTEDPAECTHKTLNVTVSNATFEMISKGALHKMNVK